jgi:hypothetical protein
MYGSARLIMENDTYYMDIDKEAYEMVREKINIDEHLK